MKQVLVEGWRGINQSYAMVNQQQLLALLGRPGLELSHDDVPFANPAWNARDNDPGFAPDAAARLNAIPHGRREAYDAVYRIASPTRRSQARTDRLLTFMTGEFGLSKDSFHARDDDIDALTRGRDLMVVPSRWSRMKLLDYGFPARSIEVVSHGFDAALYRPATPAERDAIRAGIDVRPDQHVFLNLGAMTHNKGVDVLIRAFAEARRMRPNSLLMLKDDRRLYGLSASDVIDGTLASQGFRLDDATKASIRMVSTTLSMPQMRSLYLAADTYVSPYRAEGFNLPVLEAIACGTPAVVSAGGPTDDFCDPQTARFVPARQVDNAALGLDRPGYHLEPDRDALVAAMLDQVDRRESWRAACEAEHPRLARRLSWTAVADRLAALF